MVRGIDVNGSAANFVETEQIVELDNGSPETRRWTSFLQVKKYNSIKYSRLFSFEALFHCFGLRNLISNGNRSHICVHKMIN